MPAVYREKEITLRNNLSHSLERGKIDLNINVDVISRDVSSKIDFNTLSQYHREIRDHALEMSVSPPPRTGSQYYYAFLM